MNMVFQLCCAFRWYSTVTLVVLLTGACAESAKHDEGDDYNSDANIESEPGVTVIEDSRYEGDSSVFYGFLPDDASTQPDNLPPGVVSRLPSGPYPGYPCDKNSHERFEVPKMLFCGCTITGMFDCIEGGLSTNVTLCDSRIGPGDVEICDNRDDYNIGAGCLLEDPRGGIMTCACSSLGEWGCWP